MLEQLFDLERNRLVLDLLQRLPRKLVFFGRSECRDGDDPTMVRCMRRVRGSQFPPEDDETPTDASAPYPTTSFITICDVPANEEEVRVNGVSASISVVVGLDGGTWGAASGDDAKISSEQNSFLDNLNRKQHQQPVVYEWLEPGQSIATRSQDLLPDDAGYLRANIEVNRKSQGAAIAKITEPPERRPRINGTTQDAPAAPPQRRQPRGTGRNAEQDDETRRAAEQAAAAALRAQPTTDAITEWADP